MFILMYAVASAFVACRNEKPAASTTAPASPTATVAGAPRDMKNDKIDTKVMLRPPVISKCLVGSALAKDGTVAEERTVYRAKDPIYLSMWLNEAPEGLKVSLRAFDAKDETAMFIQEPATDKKVVTIKAQPQLKPGKYRVEGFWGGNSVCETYVEVRK